MRLPEPRGPRSAAVLDVLHGRTTTLPAPPPPPADPVTDDDLQLALWVLDELHYRGFDGVDDDAGWDPTLVAARRDLEDAMLAALRRDVPVPPS